MVGQAVLAPGTAGPEQGDRPLGAIGGVGVPVSRPQVEADVLQRGSQML